MQIGLPNTRSPDEYDARHNPIAPDETPSDDAQITPRQTAFAAHYVACGNGAEAARRAGYSVPSARYAARDNLQDTRIRHRIRTLAAAAEATWRDEATYLLQMLNAAMEMALTQQQPNTMIRALAQMARIAGLDRPLTALHQAMGDAEEEADDAALALQSRPHFGLIQDALADSHPAEPMTTTIMPGPEGSDMDAGLVNNNGNAFSVAAPTFPHIPPHLEDFHPGAQAPDKKRPPQTGGSTTAVTSGGLHAARKASEKQATAWLSSPCEAPGSGTAQPDG
jgi:phage terminase small subunit